MRRREGSRPSRWVAAAVVVMGASSLMSVTAGSAAASSCSGGPAIVFQGEGWRTIKANSISAGLPGSEQRYRVVNAGDNNIAVQVKGIDEHAPPGRVIEIWKGFPLGPGGAFEAFVPWGSSEGYPTIRVINLGGRLGSSVSFDC